MGGEGLNGVNVSSRKLASIINCGMYCFLVKIHLI